MRLPADLRPADGRFGSGPSKVRPAAVEALAASASSYLGTSHRQEPVRAVVRRLRQGLAELFALPEGYEVALGNGGAACFWDIATFWLIERRSQHLVFGQFSSTFSKIAAAAPHLEEPEVITSEYGAHPDPRPSAGVDLYALTHNETSTGVAMEVRRPEGAGGALVAVDATSAAGGMLVDPAHFDAYYFAPQKCFASDGGLWVALLSPAALDRCARLVAEGRWSPAILSLPAALEQSRLNQTYNTPALATLALFADQLEWMLGNGGLKWAADRSAASTSTVYEWAERSSYARPFVADPAHRSPVVATVDIDDGVDATVVSKVLRANGIVDTDSYRGLKRNQLRIACYPAVDPEDVAVLVGAIDYVVGAMP
ncbi:MAG TPA: phosphoserine transaminase [Acidimicrobiales bacterium]|nr:phosphoserine transaminase [Acidimicrobiales bacterium]